MSCARPSRSPPAATSVWTWRSMCLRGACSSALGTATLEGFTPRVLRNVNKLIDVAPIADVAAVPTADSVALSWTNESFCTSTSPTCSYWVRHKKTADGNDSWVELGQHGLDLRSAPTHTVTGLDAAKPATTSRSSAARAQPSSTRWSVSATTVSAAASGARECGECRWCRATRRSWRWSWSAPSSGAGGDRLPGAVAHREGRQHRRWDVAGRRRQRRRRRKRGQRDLIHDLGADQGHRLRGAGGRGGRRGAPGTSPRRGGGCRGRRRARSRCIWAPTAT